MRIIDKNHDYYDYLQDSTDIIVFDRRGSEILTKEQVCYEIEPIRYHRNSKYRFLLLQCGATFWLILLTITKSDTSLANVKNYQLEELISWKNYAKHNELLKLSIINFWFSFFDRKMNDYSYELIKKKSSDLKNAIDNNDFEVERTLSKGRFPLLKACGISGVVDPVALFCAIEEYFSIQKTMGETTEAKGTTNDDKIIMHGFDTVRSFRNQGRH